MMSNTNMWLADAGSVILTGIRWTMIKNLAVNACKPICTLAGIFIDAIYTGWIIFTRWSQTVIDIMLTLVSGKPYCTRAAWTSINVLACSIVGTGVTVTQINVFLTKMTSELWHAGTIEPLLLNKTKQNQNVLPLNTNCYNRGFVSTDQEIHKEKWLPMFSFVPWLHVQDVRVSWLLTSTPRTKILTIRRLPTVYLSWCWVAQFS